MKENDYIKKDSFKLLKEINNSCKGQAYFRDFYDLFFSCGKSIFKTEYQYRLAYSELESLGMINITWADDKLYNLKITEKGTSYVEEMKNGFYKSLVPGILSVGFAVSCIILFII